MGIAAYGQESASRGGLMGTGRLTGRRRVGSKHAWQPSGVYSLIAHISVADTCVCNLLEAQVTKNVPWMLALLRSRMQELTTCAHLPTWGY